MRVVVVLVAALLLSSCTWLRQELASPAPPSVTPVAKPPEAKPHPPTPHAERPVPQPQVQNSLPVPPPAPPQPDYNSRCHEMANNRVDDAKQLGASPADQAKIQNDTYKDCMAQSVPALRP
jgi:hypothetical protein